MNFEYVELNTTENGIIQVRMEDNLKAIHRLTKGKHLSQMNMGPMSTDKYDMVKLDFTMDIKWSDKQMINKASYWQHCTEYKYMLAGKYKSVEYIGLNRHKLSDKDLKLNCIITDYDGRYNIDDLCKQLSIVNEPMIVNIGKSVVIDEDCFENVSITVDKDMIFIIKKIDLNMIKDWANRINLFVQLKYMELCKMSGFLTSATKYFS